MLPTSCINFHWLNLAFFKGIFLDCIDDRTMKFYPAIIQEQAVFFSKGLRTGLS
jgi:hypothetical protein